LFGERFEYLGRQRVVHEDADAVGTLRQGHMVEVEGGFEEIDLDAGCGLFGLKRLDGGAEVVLVVWFGGEDSELHHLAGWV